MQSYHFWALLQTWRKVITIWMSKQELSTKLDVFWGEASKFLSPAELCSTSQNFIRCQRIPKKSLELKEFEVISWEHSRCLLNRLLAKFFWKEIAFQRRRCSLEIYFWRVSSSTRVGEAETRDAKKMLLNSILEKSRFSDLLRQEDLCCKVSINDSPCHLILRKPQYRNAFLYRSENCLNCKHREKYTSTSALQPINKSESLRELFKRLISMHGIARCWGKKRTRIATREFISRCFKIYLFSLSHGKPPDKLKSFKLNQFCIQNICASPRWR